MVEKILPEMQLLNQLHMLGGSWNGCLMGKLTYFSKRGFKLPIQFKLEAFLDIKNLGRLIENLGFRLKALLGG